MSAELASEPNTMSEEAISEPSIMETIATSQPSITEKVLEKAKKPKKPTLNLPKITAITLPPSTDNQISAPLTKMNRPPILSEPPHLKHTFTWETPASQVPPWETTITYLPNATRETLQPYLDYAHLQRLKLTDKETSINATHKYAIPWSCFLQLWVMDEARLELARALITLCRIGVEQLVLVVGELDVLKEATWQEGIDCNWFIFVKPGEDRESLCRYEWKDLAKGSDPTLAWRWFESMILENFQREQSWEASERMVEKRIQEIEGTGTKINFGGELGWKKMIIRFMELRRV